MLAILILLPNVAMAMNTEGSLSGARGIDGTKAFEAETQLQRDLLGRKVVIEPGSNIDEGSLFLDVAPGSTVILRAQQYDRGTQSVRTPNYRNVELPN